MNKGRIYNQATPLTVIFLHGKTFKKYVDLITASLVFVINNKQQILAVHNKRGWDIPGGHKENNETPAETAQREVLEESCVEIAQLTPFALLKNKDTGMAVFTAVPEKIHAFSPDTSDPITHREFMSLQNFLRVYTGGNFVTMQQLIVRLENRKKIG